jgi:hypothetical protein
LCADVKVETIPIRQILLHSLLWDARPTRLGKKHVGTGALGCPVERKLDGEFGFRGMVKPPDLRL